jgi:hypothetical protein
MLKNIAVAAVAIACIGFSGHAQSPIVGPIPTVGGIELDFREGA